MSLALDASNLITTQQDVAQRYQHIRQYSLDLIQSLSAEDCALQAEPFVSPAKWHLAHTTWFFETFLLNEYAPAYVLFNERFQYLFNSYYNAIGAQFARPKRHLLSRPDLATILEYREHIDVAMLEFIEQANAEQLKLIELGINHEQQHQELLLMDLKYCFFQNPLFPEYDGAKDIPVQLIHHAGFETFAGGLFEMGYQGKGFCFDNETPKHQTYLKSFQLSRSLVNNQEYLEFINDGGYEQSQHWLSDGWAWRQQNTIQHPLYWVEQDGEWFEYSLQGLKPLHLKQAVCHISFYEANAFANWKGCRLPTESEWEVAAQQSLFGPHQTTLAHMVDHNWQWTQSAYQPYPGFKTPKGAVGEYNGKFMCNQMVLRGGCDLTPKGHTRISYRNFFYPQDRWVKSGIRLAKDINE